MDVPMRFLPLSLPVLLLFAFLLLPASLQAQGRRHHHDHWKRKYEEMKKRAQKEKERAKRHGHGKGHGQKKEEPKKKDPPGPPRPSDADEDDEPSLPWHGWSEEAWEDAREERLPVVILVYPPSMTQLPKAFHDSTVVEEYEEDFIFIELRFDREDPFLREAKISKAPKLVGTDHYGNVLMRAQADLQRDHLIGFLRTLEAEAQKLAATIEARWRKIKELQDGKDRSSLIRELLRLSTAAKGYPQVARAREMIPELGTADLKKVETEAAENPKAARRSLEALIRRYRGTIVELWGQLRLAELLHDLAEVRRAFDTLGRIERSGHPDRDTIKPEIASMRATFVDQGHVRILDALRNALDHGLDAGREDLTRLKKEYSGTEVAETLNQVLRTLDR
jgi:hypothetical protein